MQVLGVCESMCVLCVGRVVLCCMFLRVIVCVCCVVCVWVEGGVGVCAFPC